MTKFGSIFTQPAPVNEAEILDRLSKASLMNVQELQDTLHTTTEGVTQQEAVLRLEKFGCNVINKAKPLSWYTQFLTCIISPFNLVLFLLALISWITDDMRSMALMLTMAFLSAIIRFYQEYRSGHEAAKLKAMVQTTTTVKRKTSGEGSKNIEVPIHTVVPGDIVNISAGDMIPADIRIITSRDLFINQAMLTGEVLPISKNIDGADRDKSVLEQPNLCFMGSNVVSGTAQGIVLATGQHTYLGSLAHAISSPPPPSNFDKGIYATSILLIRTIILISVLVFIINGLTNESWIEALMFAIAVAVGLTPEMLPMIVSANLAKGAMTMAKHKVVVKHLSAIHNFGAMDVLCTDKTGTLTMDKIVLQHHLDIHGEESADVLRYAYLNSFYQTGLKNLLDVAIIDDANLHNQQEGILEALAGFTKVDELPFDFVRRRMSVVVANKHKGQILICKGAPEELLSICTNVEDHGRIVKMTKSVSHKIQERVEKLNERGFRVLIVAYRNLPLTHGAYKKEDEQELVLKGLLAFLDPPKESAYKAIPALLDNGVQVKVITGDNAIVTKHICAQVGLPAEPILLGSEVEKMSDAELEEKVAGVSIFAKVSPMQKASIIRALRKNGYTVGFLGDGVNDALALHEADVGISVDTGVDIAKESADIILLEKSLMVLEQGIIQGRITFLNVMKYIKMTLSANFGNVLSIMGGSIFLPFLPMLPGQLLVQNFLYDLSQTTIPFDNVDKDMLSKPKNWSNRDMIRFTACFGPISSLFDYLTFALLWFYLGGDTVATQGIFQTGWFMEGLLTQTLIIHLIRTQKIPFIQSIASPWVLITTVIMVSIGLTLPFSALAHYMKFATMPLDYFIFLGVVAVSYWGVVSLAKNWYIKRYKTWL